MLLVCSDVAARGLDVQDLSHVFNVDVPFNADDYVHRIGRTGRAGKTGRAWMFVTEQDQKHLDAIEKLTKQSLKVMDVQVDSEPKQEEKKTKKPQKNKTTNDGDDDNGVLGFGEEMPAFFTSG